MAECVPFLSVINLAETIKWYENLGFKCSATNHIWEPDCELNWAMIEWDNASFMIGPDERDFIPERKDTGIWFNVDSIDRILDILAKNNIEMDYEPLTFYGRKVVTFRDLNGFAVSFSCEPGRT